MVPSLKSEEVLFQQILISQVMVVGIEGKERKPVPRKGLGAIWKSTFGVEMERDKEERNDRWSHSRAISLPPLANRQVMSKQWKREEPNLYAKNARADSQISQCGLCGVWQQEVKERIWGLDSQKRGDWRCTHSGGSKHLLPENSA